MKTKKFTKRLNLNKKTIADLNGNEMIKVKGGCSPTMDISGCPSELTCRRTFTCHPCPRFTDECETIIPLTCDC